MKLWVHISRVGKCLGACKPREKRVFCDGHTIYTVQIHVQDFSAAERLLGIRGQEVIRVNRPGPFHWLGGPRTPTPIQYWSKLAALDAVEAGQAAEAWKAAIVARFERLIDRRERELVGDGRARLTAARLAGT